MMYHFRCPECDFDDVEAGVLATERQIYCGFCAEDTGRDVACIKWPEGTEKSEGTEKPA